MNDEKKRRIQREAKEIIENAHSVRETLLVWINQGHQDLASKAYAIKSRVKDEGSLVRKVIYKIEQENKPRYTAFSATDIIGLRLLALNNEHLPTLVEAFVTFVISCQARGLNLFAGKHPHEAFKEIKLYQSRNNLSVYEEIRAHLLARGIQDKHGKPQIEFYDSTDEDPYSSIHFVCNVQDPKTSKPVPLEVQIRTVFEDAWAEIEHPLRYKGTAYFGEQPSADYAQFKKIADAFLKGLKQNLDYCLTITDDIQNLYTGINRLFVKRVAEFAVKFTPFGGHLDSKTLLSSLTPPTIANMISNSVDTQIEHILALLLNSDYLQADVAIDKTLRKLDQINENYQATHHAKFFQDTHFSFYYRMEKAFLLLLKQKAQSSDGKSAFDGQDANKALDIYLGLDRDSRYSKQAILKFRLATAAKVAGKMDIAQTAMYEADRLLKTDQTIPPDHILRITIPRQYSLILWLRKQEIWHADNQAGEPRARSSDQIQILRRCLRKTRDCMLELNNIKASDEKAVEELRLFNNQISYAWELQDLGERTDLTAQEKTSLRAFLPKLEAVLTSATAPVFTRRLSGIDSVLKACYLLGLNEQASEYRKIMLEQLKQEELAPIKEYASMEIEYFLYSLQRLKEMEDGNRKGSTQRGQIKNTLKKNSKSGSD